MGDRLNLDRQWLILNKKIKNSNSSLPSENIEDKNDFTNINDNINSLIRTIRLYATKAVLPKLSQSLMNSENNIIYNSMESTRNASVLESSTSISSRRSALDTEKNGEKNGENLVIGEKKKEEKRDRNRGKEKESDLCIPTSPLYLYFYLFSFPQSLSSPRSSPCSSLYTMLTYVN